MRIGAALACLLALGGASGRMAQAQEVVDAQTARIQELEKRVRDLEEVVRHVQGTLAGPEVVPAVRVAASLAAAEQAAPVAQEGTNPIPQDMVRPATEDSGTAAKGGRAGWDKGFFIESADKQHTLRITGQIQTDYRSFQNDGDTTDIDTFLLRRARFGIEATVFKYYEFRFLPDFGQSKATIQDSYLNIHYLDAFQFQAGKFKEPVSYEQLVQDRFVPTMERSLIDQVVPARDIGLMVHGQQLLNNQLDYAIGIFNGEINGGSGPPAPDSDTNKLRDIAARIAWRPLNAPALPECLHLLQLGISGTTGIEKEPINPATLRLPSTVPYFTFNTTVVADGLRTRLTPEISYFYRGLGMAAQYFRMNQEMRPFAASPLLVDVPYAGGYVMLTYLITGEERTTYSQPISPLRPFALAHPFTNPGAWELVVRVSRLDVGDVVFAPGAARLADPAKYSNSASELTVGFNWYFNALVRMQFNYEHGWFGDPVLLGPPKTFFRNSDALLARMQIIF